MKWRCSWQPTSSDFLCCSKGQPVAVRLDLSSTWRTAFIGRGESSIKQPLQTVACHEDLSATDLVGRFLLKAEETVWQDGPLSRAVKEGSICYLDEIVEARKDSTVLIHSLTDHRRILPVEKLGSHTRGAPELFAGDFL